MQPKNSDSHPGLVLLRDAAECDLPVFFQHQRDPVANRMAAFPGRDEEAFMAHWTSIFGDDAVIKKTILYRDQVAGNIQCFEHSGKELVGYWIGREFWSKGIATSALSTFVTQVKDCPLDAFVAKTNIGSIRVLEKCGFVLSGEVEANAVAFGDPVEEFLFTLSK